MYIHIPVYLQLVAGEPGHLYIHVLSFHVYMHHYILHCTGVIMLSPNLLLMLLIHVKLVPVCVTVTASLKLSHIYS